MGISWYKPPALDDIIHTTIHAKRESVKTVRHMQEEIRLYRLTDDEFRPFKTAICLNYVPLDYAQIWGVRSYTDKYRFSDLCCQRENNKRFVHNFGQPAFERWLDALERNLNEVDDQIFYAWEEWKFQNDWHLASREYIQILRYDEPHPKLHLSLSSTKDSWDNPFTKEERRNWDHQNDERYFKRATAWAEAIHAANNKLNDKPEDCVHPK